MNALCSHLRWPVAMVVCGLVLAACTAPLEPSYTTQAPATSAPTVFQPAASDTPVPTTQAATGMSTMTETATPAPTETPGLQTVTSLPNPSGFTWTQVVNGLHRPTALVDTRDGSGRMLVLEQAGVIRILQSGNLSSDPFMDISDRVGADSTERGLLGIALDPDYASNRTFYLDYTNLQGNTTISRFTASADGASGDPASEQILLQIQQPYANHNGGQLAFGPDGYLYIGMGDGGSQGDPHGNAQNTSVKLGKILRIDVRGQPTYTIPADNPFAGGNGAPEVWAYGLRNPWRFSFDTLTGDLYIADVGQDKYEEIDFLPAGSPGGTDFGWNFREGLHAYNGTPPAGLQLTDPVFEYDHSQGCSVSGGYVYRGASLPEFYGVYLFGDYCTGRVWGLVRGADGSWQGGELFQIQANISSFGQDASGEVYLLDHGNNAILRLTRK